MQYFLETAIPITAQNWSNNTSPLVSIQCITYNHEKYIRDALEGFLMQKTTFPVEILIHDDASTDNTANIIREYQAKYPQLFKPIYQIENQYSQKKGVITKIQNERTKGKYIAKCEGDDYWTDPLKLQKQVDFLEENEEYSMCFHNAIIYETSAKRRSLFLFNNFTSDCTLSIEDIICSWAVPTASILCKREYIDLPDWLARIYSGDYSLLLSLFIKGKIRYLDTISSVYRRNLDGNSVSVVADTNFVRKQHILLLQSFNNGTNHIYNDVITNRIKYIKKEINLREAIWNKKYHKFIFMLPELWRNSIRLLKEKLKRSL